jgi:hypothetical protein
VSGGTASAAILIQSAGSVTPSFTLTVVFISLYIFPHGDAPASSCAGFQYSKQLFSGTSITFSSVNFGGWDYCSDYVNAPASAIAPLTCTWSQP